MHGVVPEPFFTRGWGFGDLLGWFVSYSGSGVLH